MKRCVNCGEELPKGANYCGVCGSLVAGPQRGNSKAVWQGLLIAAAIIIVFVGITVGVLVGVNPFSSRPTSTSVPTPTQAPAAPRATASAASSTVYVGDTITLSGGPSGMSSYSWTGPAGFSSSQQSPVIRNATTAMSGTYTLTVRDASGGQSSASLSIRVQERPRQRLSALMYPGAYMAVPTNPKTFKSNLAAGERVEGFIRLTGAYSSLDWSSTVTLKFIDPRANVVHSQSASFGSGGAYREFAFTATHAGEYLLEVRHYSYYNRDLVIEISPTGWN